MNFDPAILVIAAIGLFIFFLLRRFIIRGSIQENQHLFHLDDVLTKLGFEKNESTEITNDFAEQYKKLAGIHTGLGAKLNKIDFSYTSNSRPQFFLFKAQNEYYQAGAERVGHSYSFWNGMRVSGSMGSSVASPILWTQKAIPFNFASASLLLAAICAFVFFGFLIMKPDDLNEQLSRDLMIFATGGFAILSIIYWLIVIRPQSKTQTILSFWENEKPNVRKIFTDFHNIYSDSHIFTLIGYDVRNNTYDIFFRLNEKAASVTDYSEKLKTELNSIKDAIEILESSSPTNS